jgi:hypothetical protein
MSQTDDTPSWDDLDTVEVSRDDDGNHWIELDAGEEITGRITAFNPLASYEGVVEIDGRPYRLNATMRKQIIAGLVEGCTIGIRKSEETDTFENDDGEQQEYNPREVAVSR